MKVFFHFVVCLSLVSAIFAGDLPKSRSHAFLKAADAFNQRAPPKGPNGETPKPLPADINPNVRSPHMNDLSGLPMYKVKPFTKAHMVREEITAADYGALGDSRDAVDLSYAYGSFNDPSTSEFISNPGYTQLQNGQTGKGPHGSANGDLAKPGVYFGITPYVRYHWDWAIQEYTQTVEWHCLDGDWWSQSIVAVHGTYDNIGYFDGNFLADGAALVNYYENSHHWGNNNPEFVPTTGSALLVYDNSTWLLEGGYNWPSGQSTTFFFRGFDPWGGFYYRWPCYNCIPDESESWGLADWVKFTRKVCLWSPFDYYHRTIDDNLTNQIYGPKGAENTWTTDGIGQNNGSTMGAYTYTYSEEECDAFEEEGIFSCEEDGNVETGHYNLNAVSALVGRNRVLVSSWNATSGPLRGQTGPQVGVFQSNVAQSGPHTDDGLERSSFTGFFCYAKRGDFGSMIATNCTSQVSRNKGRDKKAAEKLLDEYQAFKKSGFYRLKWLVDLIWG